MANYESARYQKDYIEEHLKKVERKIEPAPLDKRPSKLDNKNYQLSHLRYPDDVSVSVAQKHYVVFYISVPEGTATSLAGENTIGVVSTAGESSVNISNANTGVLTAAGVVAGAVIGANSMASFIKKGRSLGAAASIPLTVGLVGVATVAGAVVGGNVAAAAFKKTQYMRINDAITLGLHNVPENRSTSTWGTSELGSLGGTLAGGSSSADSSKGSSGMDFGKIAARNALKIPGSAQATKGILDVFGGFSDKNAEAVASLISKEVPNPFKEQIFTGTEFREFHFSYHFMPKDANEAKAVKDIIEKFRFHMHPDLNASGLFLKFPSQFDIVYYFNGELNTNLNKIATCVLVDCSVKYGSDNNKFSSFSDGVPVETTISLKFRETSLLTKAQIKQGF